MSARRRVVCAFPEAIVIELVVYLFGEEGGSSRADEGRLPEGGFVKGRSDLPLKYLMIYGRRREAR
jgi:hypothetical protein